MSADPRAAVLALHRFGFGPRHGSIAAIASDPRGALLAELERPGAGRLDNAELVSSAVAARQSADDAHARRKALFDRRQAELKRASTGPQASLPQESAPKKSPPLGVRILQAEVKARADAALGAEIGLTERLVWFWSNHFCIATKNLPLRAMGGAFEREAIRPYVLGRFVDMLQTVESHPAMLLYLDNARSIGPNSPMGKQRNRGLNENLAREILELHTLGVRTVYSQEDVTTFAKVITGWGIVPPAASSLHGGEFEFHADRHEPGAKTLLGRTYAEDGLAQGRAVLSDLAAHPATAHHIATKLVTHFVADIPPTTLVDRLAKRFRDTGGDLKQVTVALLQSDEAWQAPRTKLKRPSEWFIGAMRAGNVERADVHMVMQAQAMLGEPLWRPNSPKGYSDQTSEWMDGLAERLDIATHLARNVDTPGQPSAWLDDVLGPWASDDTRRTVTRAEDRTQALALLVMAPEFQLR
jgi:uncharacterized protein (DUF1800 family)